MRALWTGTTHRAVGRLLIDDLDSLIGQVRLVAADEAERQAIVDRIEQLHADNAGWFREDALGAGLPGREPG